MRGAELSGVQRAVWVDVRMPIESAAPIWVVMGQKVVEGHLDLVIGISCRGHVAETAGEFRARLAGQPAGGPPSRGRWQPVVVARGAVLR